MEKLLFFLESLNLYPSLSLIIVMKSNKLLQLGCFLCCALIVGFLLIIPAQASDLSPEKIEQVEALIQE